MTMISTAITEHKDGRFATVTIDRAEKLNVLNSGLVAELTRAISDLASDDDLRLVILTGAGDKAFIGGADIADMANLTPETAKVFISNLHGVMAAIRNLPVPVIARIDGYCLGGGLEVAAACDLRIASNRSKFSMPEVHVGIPSVIDAALLGRLMGRGKAARLVYTGEMIDAAKAYDWGFLEEVTLPEELDQAVEQVRDTILAAGPNAIRAQKKLLNAWDDMTLSEAVDVSIPVFATSFETPEPTERMQAFLAGKKK